MNTNCSKCGNPLQAGTTICPVCGTNNINVNAAPAQAAAAPAAAPAQVAAAPAAAPQIPVDAALTAAAAPVAPQAPVSAEVPAAPVADANSAPVQAAAPAAQPAVAPVAPVQPTGAVPVVTPSATAPATPPKEKPKSSPKTLIIIIVVGLVLIGGVVGVLLFINGSNNPTPVADTPTVPDNNNNNNQGNVAQSNVVTIDDLEYNIPSGWQVSKTENFVTLFKNENLQIDFTYMMQVLTEQDVVDLFASYGIADVQVNPATVANKNAITADFNSDGSNIRMYFVTLDTGTLMAGVEIYSDAVKGEVEKIIGSIKHIESENAIAGVDSFHEVVSGIYDKIEELNNGSEENGGTTENPNGGSQGGGF